MSSARRTDPANARDRAGRDQSVDRATGQSGARDGSIAKALGRWFASEARDLPWRDAPPGERDPYRVLVSELMLQQTQASRVAERYPVFIQRFPTAAALASADEQEVLALWSGLGYYRRARSLHAAAKAVVERFGGELPNGASDLRSIPGVGAYTAGAIASLAFGLPEPAADGNVTRVFLRLDGRPLALGSPEATGLAARRASEVIGAGLSRRPRVGPGTVNEALIELGATVCTPRSPRCDRCPLAKWCVARRDGLTESIPAPKRAAKKKVLHALTVLAIDRRGARLVERRGDGGLWAGLWQAPTVESTEPIDPAGVKLGGAKVGERIDAFVHETTHRSVRFVVHAPARVAFKPGPGAVWKTPEEIGALGLSSAQRRILLNIRI